MDVIKVDGVADGLMDTDIGARRIIAGRREPRRDWSVRDDVRRGQLSTEFCLECDQPRFGLVAVHRCHVFVVNIDTVETVVLDKFGELLPLVVGESVDPKAEIIRAMPES